MVNTPTRQMLYYVRIIININAINQSVDLSYFLRLYSFFVNSLLFPEVETIISALRSIVSAAA